MMVLNPMWIPEDQVEIDGTIAMACDLLSPIRTPGVHVSDIIALIKKDNPGIGGTKVYKDGNMSMEQLRVYQLLGLAWEEAMLKALAARYGVDPHPPETTLDGIVLNPDGLWLQNPRGPAIVECKLTFRSLRTAHPSKQWDWKAQVMCYCKKWGIRNVVFYNIYCVGNYADLRFPTPVVHEEIFTQEEIDKNWQMMVAGRDRYLKLHPEKVAEHEILLAKELG